MKLIDLLVKELPKRGGWPDGADCCCVSGVDSDGVTIQFRFIPRNNQFLSFPDADHLDIPYQGDATEFITCEVIAKEVYQSALAASQKPVWNGEGLPPSGVECEARLRCNDGEWFLFRCVGVDCGVAFGWAGKEAATLGKGSYEFRPLRTEAERKRDVAVRVIKGLLMFDYGDDPRVNDATFIYDAIAAGKIPGVKLDD